MSCLIINLDACLDINGLGHSVSDGPHRISFEMPELGESCVLGINQEHISFPVEIIRHNLEVSEIGGDDGDGCTNLVCIDHPSHVG